MNLYLYGRASPVVMVDPNGMDSGAFQEVNRELNDARRPSHSFQMDNPPAPPAVGARSAGKDESGHEVIEIENIEVKGTPNLERTPREQVLDDPATVRAVQGTGVIEGSDVVQFLKAMWSGPASWVNAPEFEVDPYNQGADWMGREFGKNLALGGIGKGVGVVFGEARALIRGLATLGDDVALGVESALKADTALTKAIPANVAGMTVDDAAAAFAGMRGGGGHAMRRLVEAGMIANKGSLAARVQQFEQLTGGILRSPTHRFPWKSGITPAEGFVGKVGGEDVFLFVATEGPYKGKVISSGLVQATDWALWGLKQ